MKTNFLTSASLALALLSAGCSTPTALDTPIGPNPQTAKFASATGTLRVYSAKEKEDNVGFEQPYEQRTDYSIYDANGKEVKGVLDNNKGEFEAVPRGVRLEPGTYKIKALAAVGLGEWISVPVVIEAGRTTEVHLNGQWRPPSDTPGNEIVKAPSGFPMGWRASQ